jgi:hypothetical protein
LEAAVVPVDLSMVVLVVLVVIEPALSQFLGHHLKQ